MSIKVVNTQGSGFFPQVPGSYSGELALNGPYQGGEFGGTLFTMPLACLVPIYWKLKSATITANLTYSIPFTLGYSFPGNGIDTGTYIGTDTISSANAWAHLPYTTLSQTTQQRVQSKIYYPEEMVFMSYAYRNGSYTMNGAYTYNGSSPYPYSINTGSPIIVWMETSNNCIWADTSGNYYTRLFFNVFVGYATGVNVSNNWNASIFQIWPDQTANVNPNFILDLQINGTSIVPSSTFPLFDDNLINPYTGVGGLGGPIGLSGTLTINFNTFNT